jgi:ABC-type transporter Mla subunit MlaD
MSERLTRERLGLEVARATRPLAIVLLMLALGLTAMVLLMVRLGVKLPGEGRHDVRIAVTDARGVTPGATEVRISGVVVGRVTRVERVGRHAVLTAQIQPRFGEIYRDATLRLRPKTPLEDMYVSVDDRGHPTAGVLEGERPLAASRTRTPVEISDVVDVFDADVRPQMARAIAGLGRGLRDRGAQLRGALTELAPFLVAARRLTTEAALRARETRRLVHNFGLLSAELGRRDDQLDRLVGGGAGTLGQLADAGDALGATIEALPPALSRMPHSFATVRTAADALDGALVALGPTARALPSGLRSLTALAPQLARGAAALRRPLEPLRSVARALPVLATDLRAGITSLRPQAPRLDRATAAVVPCELAVDKFFNWTLSVGKFADVRGAALRGEPVVGTNTALGVVPDLKLTDKPSCAAAGVGG